MTIEAETKMVKAERRGICASVPLIAPWRAIVSQFLHCNLRHCIVGKIGDPQMSSSIQSNGNGHATRDKLGNRDYERELRRLHVELVNLQQWVVREGVKICIVFEGRDAAGKGGAIKAITERVSPRVFRVVALPAPSEREKKSDVCSTVRAAFTGGRRGGDF
jgi:hypothetical protein